uniref:NADH dehydrogenase subunit 2 n=1 Tax=Hygrobates turcicus TaxID=2028090 RepID=UPI002237DA80|nr:NADH dehydrogenase subunit 2 [Hygrobates turcicus]UYS90933.1 NADH dehydrogenase subunit 2 [Hygrobates turcicus]
MVKWLILFMAPLGALSSKSWIFIWSFLEMSSFIFIIFLKESKKSEISMMYFLVQSLSSSILLLSLVLNEKFSFNYQEGSFLPSSLLILSLVTKCGLFPMHMWMVEIANKMSSMNIFIFLTIMKIAPLTVIMKSVSLEMLFLIIIFSSGVSVVLQFSSLDIKILMTFSSVSHSSWMCFSCLISYHLMMFYFFTYSLILFLILKEVKNKSLKSVLVGSSKSKSLSINILSLSGIPPLLGFFPKWCALMEASKLSNMKFLSFFLLMMNCLNVFIYLRLITYKSLNMPLKMKNESKMESVFQLDTLINLLPLAILIFMF